MPSLHELQQLFSDAILTDRVTPLASWISQPDPVRRLGIYRNNVFTNLRETLRTLYPVIERLVGVEFFAYTAKNYIQRYPSPAGDLNCFGVQLADFLTDFEPAVALPYLPDTARLEWQTHVVYHAGEHPPLLPAQLENVPADQYDDLFFSLHPASRLFASSYPVHHIWQVNQEGYSGDQQVNLDSGDVRLLIERRNRKIEIQVLDQGEWALLQAMTNNQSLASATDAACAAAPDFDLAGSLSRLIAQSTLVAFTVGECRGNTNNAAQKSSNP